MTLIGLHGRADGRMQSPDWDCVRVGKIESLKLLSIAAPEDVNSFQAIRPGELVMVRLFVDLGNRMFTPADFVQSVLVDLELFYQRGTRLFEVTNEPNLRTEGRGLSWSDGAGFGNWFADVCQRLKSIHPDLLLGWPGLSPGPRTADGLRADEIQFLDQGQAGTARADFIGIHCYWTGQGDINGNPGGASYMPYLSRFSGKPLYITEFSIPNMELSKSEKGQQYVRYWQGLPHQIRAAFSFISSASQGFESETWAETDARLSPIPAIVGSRTDTTMTNLARGIDVSGDNQVPAGMRFMDWRSLSFCYGWVEWTNGTRLIPFAATHRLLMLSANYLVGAYANLRADDKSPEEQCDKFLGVAPYDDFYDMLDAELSNLTENMIRRWVIRHQSKTRRRLTVYTGTGVWERIVPDTQRFFYSSKFGLVLGSYPFDTPPDPVTHKDVQPMDLASIALRSNPPANRKPVLPKSWISYFSWQHTGHGSLPGYDGFLDLHVSTMTELELRQSIVPVVSATIAQTPIGIKLGPGQVGNGQAITFVKDAASRGANLPALFGMDNAGLAIDGQGLVKYKLTRIVQGETDAAPGMDSPLTDAQLLQMARNQLVAYQRLSDAEKQAADFVLPWNEPRPATIDGYLRLTSLMSHAVDVFNAAGFKVLVYAFNAGTPEADEWRAMVRTGINEQLISTGNGIAFHHGVLGQPGVPDSQSDTVDDHLLTGAWLVNPITGYRYFLPNADSLVLRHRLFRRIADEENRPVAPLWGTELYMFLKPTSLYMLSERIRRYTWIDHQLSLDPEVVASFPYAIGQVGVGLPANDHTDTWPGLIDLAVTIRNRINSQRGDTSMDEITRTKINDFSAQIDTSLTAIATANRGIRDAIAAQNWWDVIPDGLINPPRQTHPLGNSLSFYHLPTDPSAYTSRTYTDPASANIDVYGKSGRFMRVTIAPSPVIWVLAAQLQPFV